jgi:hypothetical protein
MAREYHPNLIALMANAFALYLQDLEDLVEIVSRLVTELRE